MNGQGLALLVRYALLVLLLLATPVHAVTVAVVDSGIDGSHPELAGRVTHRSFADPQLPGGVVIPTSQALADADGQGTGVASLIAGASLGVAPNATLLDLRVRDAADQPADEAAVRALEWLLAQDEKPDIAVLSFASAGISEENAGTLAAQSRSLFDAGVLVIVAGADGITPLHRDAAAFVVADVEGCTGSVSEPGAPAKPDVVARSLAWTVANPGLAGQGGTRVDGGTAYAAAFVAGVAAAMLAQEPALGADSAAALLRGASWEPCAGWGEVTLDAIARADGWTPTTPKRDRDAPLPFVFAVLALSIALWGRRRGI